MTRSTAAAVVAGPGEVHRCQGRAGWDQAVAQFGVVYFFGDDGTYFGRKGEMLMFTLGMPSTSEMATAVGCS